MPCVSNSLEDEDIDSQRPEPQFAGAARYRCLRHPDFRNLFRGARSTLSGRRVRLFPVQPRRRADRRRAAGRRHLRRCGAQCRRIYPYVGGAARCGVGGVGAGRRGAHLVDPRARGVPPRLAPGSRGRGLDHGFRAGFLPAGRRGPVAPRQGVSPGFPERPIPRPGRGGSACGRPLPGCSRGACAGAGTGRNVKCRNTNILASYFYV